MWHAKAGRGRKRARRRLGVPQLQEQRVRIEVQLLQVRYAEAHELRRRRRLRRRLWWRLRRAIAALWRAASARPWRRREAWRLALPRLRFERVRFEALVLQGAPGPLDATAPARLPTPTNQYACLFACVCAAVRRAQADGLPRLRRPSVRRPVRRRRPSAAVRGRPPATLRWPWRLRRPSASHGGRRRQAARRLDVPELQLVRPQGQSGLPGATAPRVRLVAPRAPAART